MSVKTDASIIKKLEGPFKGMGEKQSCSAPQDRGTEQVRTAMTLSSAAGGIPLKGCSKALGWMNTGFLGMFILALLGHILTEVIGV